METNVAQADSKRKYSWWWDSHISPKNSKWLQENLTDMDTKVKQMIKLIEEDADSFARRAEMYYKKRPELMKLVEEFYRAYRALAERYDHATGVIRHAHKTMAEAFPNQVPFMMGEDGSGLDGDPRTPDADESQNDGLGSNTFKKNRAFTEEHDSPTSKMGLKQRDELFVSVDRRVRKGLDFSEDKVQSLQDNGSHDRLGKAELEISTLKNALAKLEAERKAGLHQYEQSLKRLSNLESEFSLAKEDSKVLNERANKAEAEVNSLREMLVNLQGERESSQAKYQQCLDKISDLKKTISRAQENAGELSERARQAEKEGHSLKEYLAQLRGEKDNALLQCDESVKKIADLESKLVVAEEDSKRSIARAEKVGKEVEALKQEIAKLTEEKEAAAVQYLQCLEKISSLERKLAEAEEKCQLMENSNQTMRTELETLTEKVVAQGKELTEKHKELGRLWTCIQEERLRFSEAENAFQTLQNLHAQSQEELRSVLSELQKRALVLEGLEARNRSLQNEVELAKEQSKGLTDVNMSSSLTIKELQDEISSLRVRIRKLEAEVDIQLDQRNTLQQEIYCLKAELNGLNKKHQDVTEQVESVGLSTKDFGSSVKGLQDENARLKETCETDRTQKVALLEKLAAMEKLIEKNVLLEISLLDLNAELGETRDKVRALEESCQSLMTEKSTIVSEKATLVMQLRMASDSLEKLRERNIFLQNSLFDATAELEDMRKNLKNLEELYASLETDKVDQVLVKENLMCQLDITQKTLEDLKGNYVVLEEKYFSLEKEKQLTLLEVEDLRIHLHAERQERSDLVSHIHLLQEEGQCKKIRYEEELNKAMNSEIEIFLLQKCVKDMEEENCSLSLECDKFIQASEFAAQLISELKKENLAQKVEVKSLTDQIQLLRAGIYQVLRTLDSKVNLSGVDKGGQDGAILNSLLNKLKEKQGSLLTCQDENHLLLIENSVLIKTEAELWESQAITLFEEMHMFTVREVLLEGKLYEICEARWILENQIDQLDKRVSFLEGENGELKAQMSACIPAFISLCDSISSLEKTSLLLTSLDKVDNKEVKAGKPVEYCKSSGQTSKKQHGPVANLKELEAKIQAIQTALAEKERIIILENSRVNSKQEAATKQIEDLKSVGNSRRRNKGKSDDIDIRIQRRTHEISDEGSESTTKDIMLDQVSDSSSYEISRRRSKRDENEKPEMWETTHHDCSIELTVENNRKANAAAMKKKNNRERNPSLDSLFSEKEVAIDKLEILENFSGSRSRREMDGRKILERLDSDEQRLTNLQITVQDLKRKVETTENSNKGKGIIEYESVKEQLEESEETIMKLFEVIRKLVKNVEGDSSSFDENSSLDENKIARRRKISEHARRGSEKIARLQLEVQKLQFLMLKFDEANKSRGKTKISEWNRRVVLRDYLYGGTRTPTHRIKKKSNLCSCVQPPTKGD